MDLNREVISKSETDNFFTSLSGFSQFDKFHQDQHYISAPKNWFVVISDIQGSTLAIEQGRYKDVNTLGAASISLVQSVMKGTDIPFVFGGDGATFLIPPSHIEAVKEILLKLKSFSSNQYEMTLRVGLIQVAEAYKAGQTIEVAKFNLNEKKSIAMIRGGGLSWADDQIKNNPKYCLTKETVPVHELEGLSCRWSPMKSKRGQILSIIIKPKARNFNAVFEKVLGLLNEIFEGDFESVNPMHSESLQYKTLFKSIVDEWRYNSSHLSLAFFRRLFSIVVSSWTFKLKLPSPIDASGYTSQISSHSDYRKVDDMLRMIVDCTNEQMHKIESLLKNLHLEGTLYYGMHSSSHALMTCLVQHLGQGGHIHFIDGGDGGYAVAAKQLKLQIKSDTSSLNMKTGIA